MQLCASMRCASSSLVQANCARVKRMCNDTSCPYQLGLQSSGCQVHTRFVYLPLEIVCLHLVDDLLKQQLRSAWCSCIVFILVVHHLAAAKTAFPPQSNVVIPSCCCCTAHDKYTQFEQLKQGLLPPEVKGFRVLALTWTGPGAKLKCQIDCHPCMYAFLPCILPLVSCVKLCGDDQHVLGAVCVVHSWQQHNLL